MSPMHSLAEVIHGVFLYVGVGIYSPDVLCKLNAAIFCGNGKDGAIKLAPGGLDEGKF